MKRILLCIAVSLCAVGAQAQLTNYKVAQEAPNANYYSIVQEWRGLLSQKKAAFEAQNPGKTLPHALREEIAQFERWAYNWQDKVFADGRFPGNTEGWKNATAETNNSTLQKAQAGTWTSIGPLNTAVSNGWTYGAGIGRINVVKQRPGTNTIFAGSAAGGLFKSDNWGANWTPLTDDFAGLGVSDIVFHPTNNNIAYLVTGDFDGRHIASLGIFKSTYGGNTWAATGQVNTLNQQDYYAHLVMDPADPNILMVGGKFDIFRSVDAGATWTTWFAQSTSVFMNDIVKVNGSWYATARGNGNIWKENPAATNENDRMTVVLNTGTGRVDIATTANDPNTLYLLKETNPAFAKFNTTTDALVAPFSNVTNANPSDDNANFNTQQGYNQVIAVSPTNKDSIWVGEFSGGKLSTDGGVTWQNKLNGYYDPASSSANWGGFYVHSDHHHFEWVGSDTLLVGNDGGVYVGKLSTNNFAERFNGLVTTQSYSMAIFDAEPNNLMIGNQDNDGTSRIENGGTSTFYGAQAGDGTATAISRTDKNIRYVGSTQGGLSYRTDGYGTSAFGTGIAKPSDAPFVWDLQMHNTDGSILYGGFTGVYKMTGAPTGSWTLLNTGATQKVKSITLANNNAGSQKIIIINEDNTVSKSADETNWTDIVKPTGVNFSSIYAVKANWDTLFATATAYNAADKIFMSTDNGGTWVNITKNFPNIQVKKIIRWEGHDSIFVATELGVYFASIANVTSASTTPWAIYGSGLPRVRIEDMEISNTKNELYVSSFGRGVWVSPLANATVLPVQDLSFTYNTIADNNIALSWKIREQNIQSTTLEFSKDGLNFNAVATYTNQDKYEKVYITAAPAQTTYYRLQYTNSSSRKQFSNILIVRANDNNSTVIYPNPAADYATINNTKGIQTVIVYASNGQQVAFATPASNNYVLPTHLLPKGQYVVVVINNLGEKTTSRLQKQ